MIRIAGKRVKKGDWLYHGRAEVWGQVVGFDPTGPAIFKVTVPQHGERTLLVQNGGKINGIKVIYWHEPLNLDLPFNDLTRIRRLVDFYVKELYGENNEPR